MTLAITMHSVYNESVEINKNKIRKIVLLDDNPDDRFLVRRELQKVIPDLILMEPTNQKQFDAILETEDYDLVITDYQLHWTNGMDILKRLKREQPLVPVVMFTGTGNEEIAVSAMKAGLDDYILKKNENYAMLARTVKTFLQVRQQKEKIIRMEKYYKTLFDSVPIGLYITSPDGKFRDINRAMIRLFRFPDKATMKAVNISELYLDPNDLQNWRRAVREKGMLSGKDIAFRRYDGTVFWGRETGRIVLEGSRIIRYEGAIEDVTEKKKTEEQLKQSEMLYRTTVNQAREAIFLIDKETKTLFKFNSALREMLGYPADDMASLTAYDFMAQNPDAIDSMLRKLKKHRNYFLGEGKYRRKNGTLIDVESSAHLVNVNRREVIAFVARDIGERKRLQLERERYTERIRSILNTIRAGVILLAEDHSILLINPLAEKYIEKIGDIDSATRLVQLNGRDIDDFLKPSLVDRPYYRIRIEGTDPRVFEIECSTVSDNPDKREYVLVIRDITREYRMQTIVESHQRLAAVGQLTGGLAHDFNNILTAIQGYSDLLIENSKLDEDALEDLREIRHAAKRASALIRHLLAFSRKQMMKPEIVDLNRFLNNIESKLSLIAGNNIEIHYELDKQILKVRIDPGQLERVIINIVINAREAMPEGGFLYIETAMAELHPEDYYRYVGAKPGQYVKLTLRDTGIGMDESVRQRVFEPFFTTKSRFKRAGLGLSTSYGIIKQSDGYIWVDSEIGKGSAFHIFLPPAHLPPEAQKDKNASPERFRGMETILIVEDEDMVRSLSRSILDRFGYTVLEAANAEAAERILNEYSEPVHLAVIDIFMPGTGGIELARRIRETNEKIRFLFVSGYFDSEKYTHEIKELGSHLLPKPFSPLEFISKIRTILDT